MRVTIGTTAGTDTKMTVLDVPDGTVVMLSPDGIDPSNPGALHVRLNTDNSWTARTYSSEGMTIKPQASNTLNLW